MKQLKGDRDLFNIKSTHVDKKKKKFTSAKRTKNFEHSEAKKQKKEFEGLEIQPISFENVTEGQIILGCVSEVREYELIISLPYRMYGHVPIKNISKSYTNLLSKVADEEAVDESIYSLKDLYSVGHFVVTCVKSVININEKVMKVVLSMLPEDVNAGIRPSILTTECILQCAVNSVEDKGYVMDIGIPNLRSVFLSMKQAPDGCGIVGIGSVLLCAVKSIKGDEEGEGGIEAVRIKLSAKPRTFSEACRELNDSLNISSLIPGTLVEISVQNVFPEYLMLSAGSISGVASADHLINPIHTTADYTVGQKVRARVLYVTHFTHMIHFTLNPNICSQSFNKDPLKGFKVGDTVENAQIYKSGKHGIHLKLTSNCQGFCSANRLKDGPTLMKNIKTKFPVGSRRTCRVIKYNLMDQLFIVGIKASLLEQQVIGQLDLEIGKVMKVTINNYDSLGAVVTLSKTVSGCVPMLHLTDSNMKDPEAGRPVGKTFKARIIRHLPGKRPNLTLKSALVNSELPIVCDFDKKYIGVITDACIAVIYDHCLLVEFYNGAKGFISQKNAIAENVENLTDVYKVGQVVRCKIVSVDPEKKKMMASMKYNKSEKEQSTVIKIKEKVNCKVKSIEDGRVFVSIEGRDSGIKAFIPVIHLADDISLCNRLYQILKVGDLIEGAIVFAISKASEYTLSLKSILYQSVKENMKTNGSPIAKLKVGDIFPGVIEKQHPTYIVLKLMEGNYGNKRIIGMKNIVDGLFNSVEELGLSVGQTIFAKYLGSNEEMEKAIFTSFLDEVLTDKSSSSLQLLYNNVASEINLGMNLEGKEGLFKQLLSFKVGDEFIGKVEFVAKKVGVLVSIPEMHVDGVISINHLEKSSIPRLNSTTKVCVLHVNLVHCCLELSLKEDMKGIIDKEDHGIEVGQEALCEVVLTKREYIKGRLKNLCSGQIVYLPSKRHVNDFRGRTFLYEVGKEYKVVIRYVEKALILADFHAHCSDRKPVNIITDLPRIVFTKKTLNESCNIESLTSSRNSFTVHDFSKRANNKLNLVTQCCISKHAKKNLTSMPKLEVLEKDDFPQFNEEFYWNYVSEKRNKTKKLKKHGLKESGKTKAKKRPRTDSQTLENSPNKKIKQDVGNDSKNQGILANAEVKTKGASKKTCLDLKETKNKPCLDLKETKNKPFVDLKETENKPCLDLKETKNKPCLDLNSNGFTWDAEKIFNENGNISDSSSSEDEAEKEKEQKSIKKMSKAERALKAKEREREIREMELKRLDPNRQPETALDYEEMLQKTPHSSSVWTQYIGFYLEGAEVQKARSIAERALQVIPATMEEERLIIWTVMLRLEVMYGNSQSIESAFTEAKITNDQLKIYQIMADTYADHNKIKEAEDIYKVMIKKFSQIFEVWIKAGQFYFQSKRLSEARAILDKAILSLPKIEHVNVANRFAQLEFKFGEVERGVTMFESLVSNFPKKLDIWNVYADLLVKQNDITRARRVLERMSYLKLNWRPMVKIFDKLKEFEKQHGTPQSVAATCLRAKEYFEPQKTKFD